MCCIFSCWKLCLLRGRFRWRRICVKLCSSQLPWFPSQIHPKRDMHLSSAAGQCDQNDSALSNLYFWKRISRHAITKAFSLDFISDTLMNSSLKGNIFISFKSLLQHKLSWFIPMIKAVLRATLLYLLFYRGGENVDSALNLPLLEI